MVTHYPKDGHPTGRKDTTDSEFGIYETQQIKITRDEVRYSSHLDFENGVIVKIYKS